MTNTPTIIFNQSQMENFAKRMAVRICELNQVTWVEGDDGVKRALFSKEDIEVIIQGSLSGIFKHLGFTAMDVQ